ncbi:MAG TPA: N-acetyl-gamma-glutamyl-phosphate reductase [Acidimicrobiales bacterium]|nr:N-acetyl-gamma-glutamyl-phosphate reductase [Acidimicrobiales bacterium]
MKAGVVGASGYLGAELLRLLAAHPDLEVGVAQADSAAGTAIAELYPGLGAIYGGMVATATDPAALSGCDVVFVALPSGHSQGIVARLVASVPVVVDLGADFRLRDPAAYELWYGFAHQAPELLGRAVCGLPEIYRAELGGARLIAAPGCYVTAAALALQPLVAAGVIEVRGAIVDAASGTSGAGRSPTATTHHATVNESFVAYGLTDHRHTPEMEQVTGAEVLFTPHLAPMTRGILATCYGKLARRISTEGLLELLGTRYAGEPFVEVVGHAPATRETYASNVAKLTARADARTGHAVVVAAIDNLTKGGAGQAIQAANVALGLAETAGLPRVAVTP